jgi:hypothetical protein
MSGPPRTEHSAMPEGSSNAPVSGAPRQSAARPVPRWARLNYPEGKKLWHAAVGRQAICGHVDFDHPRAEYSESAPERKLCRRCVAKLARVV